MLADCTVFTVGGQDSARNVVSSGCSALFFSSSEKALQLSYLLKKVEDSAIRTARRAMENGLSAW